MTDGEFDEAVRAHYAKVYRFALSLTRKECDASDLTQESFYLLAAKGRGLDDASKVKAWLFTACYREFLRRGRRRVNAPQVEFKLVEDQLPPVTADQVYRMDAGLLMEALQKVDELYRVPVTLFYLRGLTYREIATVLEIPVGTVMSRLARGKDQLRVLLGAQADRRASAACGTASFDPE